MLELESTLALDRGTRSAKALAALLADEGGGSERFVKFGFRKDAVAADAAASAELS